jgi:ribosome-associated protein
MTDPNRPSPLALARLCQSALEEKKAADVRVLNVGPLSSITDYLVIGTATSDPHLRALRVELEKVLDGSNSPIVGMETALESGWTVIDAFDVMIHLFTAERRELYGLERLWKDAAEVGPAKPVKPAPGQRAAKKRAAAKRRVTRGAAPRPLGAKRAAAKPKAATKAPRAKRV